jgi:hypothetical protein
MHYSAGYAPHFQGQIYDDNGKTIAITFDDEGGNRARQLAASTDLLEALEEIEGLPVNDDGERIIPPGFLDKARAAIAKATQP